MLGVISRKAQSTHLLPSSTKFYQRHDPLHLLIRLNIHPSSFPHHRTLLPLTIVSHPVSSTHLHRNPPSTSISDGPSRDTFTPVPWLRDPRPPSRLPSADAFVPICKFAPSRVSLSWGGVKAGQPVNVKKTGLSGFDGAR